MSVFLTAQWRALVMRSYIVEPSLLFGLVPAGTELDEWDRQTYISLVGFRFENVKVLGVPVPHHTFFEEVNLRFYVRRATSDGVRRGVVFIKEIVPRKAVAAIARWIYREPYVSMPMSHVDEPESSESADGRRIEYSWGNGTRRTRMSAVITGSPNHPRSGSEAEFIAEHYWGYTAVSGNRTREYQVTHPPWRVWSAVDHQLEGDIGRVYGNDMARVLSGAPASVFVAEGSEISVHSGGSIRA